jgi:threonine aldolase
MVSRLGEDHARARNLADDLRKNPNLVVDEGSPATNMVYLNLADRVKLGTEEFLGKLKSAGVLVGKVNDRRFRLVTHCWIDDQSVAQAVSAFNEILPP